MTVAPTGLFGNWTMKENVSEWSTKFCFWFDFHISQLSSTIMNFTALVSFDKLIVSRADLRSKIFLC